MTQVLIVGGGHNGLVLAWMLRRASIDVVLLERTASTGGACHTHTFRCGCYVNSAATVFGMFSPDLRALLTAVPGVPLNYFQTDILPIDPEMYVRIGSDWVCVPRGLAMPSLTPSYDSDLLAIQQALDVAATATMECWESIAPTHEDLRLALERHGVNSALIELLLFGSIESLLDHFHLDDEASRSLLRATNLLAPLPPTAPGTALPLLFLSRADANGANWGLVRAGIGRIASLLDHAARAAGADLICGADVTSVTNHSDGRVASVSTRDGREFACDFLAFAIDPVHSANLLGTKSSEALIETAWPRVGHFKINALLARPLDVSRVTIAAGGGPCGQLVMGSGLHSLNDSFFAASHGQLPPSLYLEVFPLYEVDRSASCGVHFPICILGMYAPYLDTGDDNVALRAHLTQLALSQLADGLGIRSQAFPAASWLECLTPYDLAQRYGMTHGNVDHGLMTSSNMLCARGTAGFATSLPENVVLASAGRHPGGLISGLPGLLAAKELQHRINASA